MLILVNPYVLITLAATALIIELTGVTLDLGPSGLGMLLYSPVVATILVIGFMAGRGVYTLMCWRNERVRTTSLAARRCASCAYDLSGAFPDPDGCVVCPECAAAWSAARLASDAGSRRRQVIVIRRFDRPLPDRLAPPPPTAPKPA